MHAVHAQRLGRRFGDLEVITTLDLAIAPREIFGLVGADGAGKTITMRMRSCSRASSTPSPTCPRGSRDARSSIP